MGIDKFNHEHYYDPTTYEALTNIQREQWKKDHPYRPITFICSPLAGDVEQNLDNARRYSKFAVEQGAIPIAPHLLFPQFLDDTDPDQRKLGLFFGLVLMGKCQQIWVFGGRISQGMDYEITKAKKRGLPIRYFDENCQEVAG